MFNPSKLISIKIIINLQTEVDTGRQFYLIIFFEECDAGNNLTLKLFGETGTRYAMLTGLVNAVQSVWDKVGVSYVNPFLYMYLLAFGGAIVLTPYMVSAHGKGTVLIEGQRNKKTIPV